MIRGGRANLRQRGPRGWSPTPRAGAERNEASTEDRNPAVSQKAASNTDNLVLVFKNWETLQARGLYERALVEAFTATRTNNRDWSLADLTSSGRNSGRRLKGFLTHPPTPSLQRRRRHAERCSGGYFRRCLAITSPERPVSSPHRAGNTGYSQPTALTTSLPSMERPPKVSPVTDAEVSPQAIPASCVRK